MWAIQIHQENGLEVALVGLVVVIGLPDRNYRRGRSAAADAAG